MSVLTLTAQTPAAKKAAQAVFSLNTFAADGTLIATSHGVFTNNSGEAISQWKPFVGAAKAIVVDASGKKYDVDGLIAANDLYDVCKFHVKGTTPTASFATAVSPEKSQLWLACYSVKAPRLLHASVTKVETFSKPAEGSTAAQEYPYYILGIQTPDDVECCPFVNANGEIVGLLQASGKSGTANAVSALYAAELATQKFGSAALTLAKSIIPVQLPKDYKDAQLSLLLAGQQRKGDALMAVIEQFIAAFPDKADGYEARAQQYTADKNFTAAAQDMEKAISVAEDKAEAHYSYSELILKKEVYMANDVYADWSLDKALKEAQAAYQISGAPAYRQQEAKVMFIQKKFDEACKIYLELQNTSLAGPETMFAATQCKQAAQAPFEDVMMLMDSTVNVCPHPLTYQSAPYIMQRGMLYQQHGDYRKAMIEYTSYERLMVGHQLSPDFYYNRFVCEREARQFQQALNDINKCIELYPGNPVYYCELGSLQLRLKMIDEAISSANKAIIIDVRNADAYAILGVAQCNKGQKHEGLLNIEQAKSLGYENADELLKKYQ